ncbi:cytochrome P450 [Melanomma pulvis-pyrius CBS 109.77]|uniref:Cytochrome P450 n=1 Tax=Melanomma pulvis-pyrius CBS 109.77 TaxID=1314802 RepID=A0A6A6XFY3_9PLEO|nr:cytochrome P450 [Melanomma pulvis-pyrius CBS 109.77]
MDLTLALSQLLRLLCYGFALRFLIVYTHRLFFNRLSHIPGPFVAKFSDWYGAYYSVLGQLHLRTWEAHQRYGPAIRLGPNKVVFNTVTALHAIYHAKTVQKSKGYIALSPREVTNTHNTIDKEVHRFKRKVLNVGLSESCMRDFEPEMNKHIENYIQKLAQDLGNNTWSRDINMTERFKYLGYDIMSHFSFGRSFQLQDKPDNRFILEAVSLKSMLAGPFFQFVDLKRLRLHFLLVLFLAKRALTLRSQWATLTNQVVRDRVAKGKDAQHDLFSSVVDAKDPETGKMFSQKELFAEARLLLVAGSDTSSTTMSALMFYLSRYPDCYEKLASEIRATFQSEDEIHSGSKMNQCTYLRACIDEALRMSPPVGSTLWREVSPGTGGIVIDGVYVPEECEVGVSTYVIHHNEEYFPDSFVFSPERWIASSSNPKERVELARRAFSPFSLGPRGCAGRTMAYMEISNVLARTMWHFDFATSEGSLKHVGAGAPNGPKGRHRTLEFQLQDHLVSTHAGPYLRFKLRKEVANKLEM